MEQEIPKALSSLVGAIPGAVTGIIALFTAWIVARTPKRGNRNDQIDQLQEDIKELRANDLERKKDIKELNITVNKQRTSITQLFARDLAWTGYSWGLERQIMQDGGTVLVVKPEILLNPITIEDE